MNGLWRNTAGALILCALLLSNEVTCQDATDAPTDLSAPTISSDASNDAATGISTAAAAADVTGTQVPTTAVTPDSKLDNQAGNTAFNVFATVINLDIKDAALPGVSSQQENEAEKPSPSDSPSASSGSSVFVGILVTGLLAALAITIAYFKCQRRSEPKGLKLAEEAYSVDQENQGNTLVSVAPLNPPPETQEKPSINGESTEPAKTEAPAPAAPNNGHSTAKTADTEL